MLKLVTKNGNRSPTRRERKSLGKSDIRNVLCAKFENFVNIPYEAEWFSKKLQKFVCSIVIFPQILIFCTRFGECVFFVKDSCFFFFIFLI